MESKVEFLLKAIDSGKITVKEALESLEKVTKKEEENISPELKEDELIKYIIFGDNNSCGLNFNNILRYCSETYTVLTDKKDGKVKPVTLNMAIDNAEKVCKDAIYLLKENYIKDGVNAEGVCQSGLFRAFAFINENEEVELTIDFIGDTSYSSCKLSDIL